MLSQAADSETLAMNQAKGNSQKKQELQTDVDKLRSRTEGWMVCKIRRFPTCWRLIRFHPLSANGQLIAIINRILVATNKNYTGTASNIAKSILEMEYNKKLYSACVYALECCMTRHR